MTPNKTFSLKNAQTEIKEEINRRLEDGELIPTRVPALSTIAECKRKLDRYQIVRVQDGTYNADRQFEPVGKLVIPDKPFMRWELDHTLLNIPVAVEARDPNGNLHKIPAGMVWATIVIDVYSRWVHAIVLGLDPPSSARSIAALRMALTPKTKFFDEIGGIEYPLDIVFIPAELGTDNGKDFHANDFIQLVGELGITLVFAGAYRGDHKPFIEKFNRTLKTFLRKIPGAVTKGARKNGPKRRDVKEPKPISIDDLTRIVWQWVFNVYHQRPHAGLGGDTPYRAMQRGIERIHYARKSGQPSPLRHIMEYSPLELEAIFAFRVSRPVDRRGLCYKGIFFNSGDLTRLITQTGCRKVDVRINPMNLGAVLVFDRIEGPWLRVPSTVSFYSEGLSLWLHGRIRARLRAYEEAKEKVSGIRKPRNRTIDIQSYLKHEGALLREVFQMTGMPLHHTKTELRTSVMHLGHNLDFAVAAARLDAIDIFNGRMPPGMSGVIDLKKGPDGRYRAEPKQTRASSTESYSYPVANDDADDDSTPETDMTKDPIAEFDPDKKDAD